jgi:enoyl-[acyl-carrier-protein] reductase (NADH)
MPARSALAASLREPPAWDLVRLRAGVADAVAARSLELGCCEPPGNRRRVVDRRRPPFVAATWAPAQLHEIGDVAAFLLSDDAARVTGQVLAVDGGAGVR